MRLQVPVKGESPATLTAAFAPLPGARLITARSPGNPASDMRTTLISEVTGELFWSAAAFVYGDDAEAAWDSTASAELPDLVVRCAGREDSWSFAGAVDATFNYPLVG